MRFATLRRYALILIDRVGHYGNDLTASVFFNVRTVSKSPAELSTPISALMGLWFRKSVFKLLFVYTVYSDISFQCAVYVLWWYESADQRAAIRQKAHGDARVVASGKSYNLLQQTILYCDYESILGLLCFNVCIFKITFLFYFCTFSPVRESAAYLVSQKNKLMFPCTFSPIK